MRQSVWALVIALATSPVTASELVHQFNSPSFSGIGYSSHVLTLEQLEHQRKRQNKDDAQAAIDRADRERKATNAYKFQNNLESRIYAQLSKQIADSMFGEGASIVEGEWYTGQTPFGDTIKWKREDDRIFVSVQNSTGETVAEFDVPVGEFAF